MSKSQWTGRRTGIAVGLGRKGRVLAVAALGAAMALPWSPARAEPEPGGWTVAGRVTDLAGRVIPNSRVSDGYVDAAADNAGSYRIDLDAQWLGWAYLTAYGRGAEGEFRQVYRTDDTEHVDFKLKYRLTAGVWPFALSDPLSTVRITAYGSMPSSDCVVAIDPASQARVPLALEATGWWDHRWSGEVSIDPGTPSGLHEIEVLAVTCDTGIELGDRARAHYLVDRAAPTVEITSPQPGRLVVDDADLAASPDGVATAVGAMRIALRAADDAALGSASIELRTLEGDFVDRCYLSSASSKKTVTGSCRFIESGDFVATAIAADLNGHQVRSAPLRIRIT